MDSNDINLERLLKETLALSEFLRVSPQTPGLDSIGEPQQISFLSDDDDYLYDLADSFTGVEYESEQKTKENTQVVVSPRQYPLTPGVIYKIDSSHSTFCVRGFSASNISEAFATISKPDSSKRLILKLGAHDEISKVCFFETKSYELAEVVREQIINRRFPHQEDAVCNISDPGFSWWMNVSDFVANEDKSGRFEIFFRSHGINRADKYIQLGPIGDGGVAALRLNQARTLLRSSFPISEFCCDEKSFSVASLKPDHLGFISFRNIFLEGINNTQLENFPDNSLGRTLYYYFHELAVVRKFWIEVKTKLS